MKLNYLYQPVTSLLKGPLLQTPQGLVVLVTAICYWLAAILLLVFELTPPFQMRFANAVGICVVWPILMFITYVRLNSPFFQTSVLKAFYLLMAALVPILYQVTKVGSAAG